MKTNNTKYRLTVSALTLLVTLLCMAAALLIPLETTTVKIVGSLASVFIVSAAAWKFPTRFYLFAMLFDIFAAALGSVINLYKYIGFYDRFVHYLSGILLAEAGMLIISYIFSVRKIEKDNLIMMLFAFFFSASCAGFWEIYEFTADNLLKTNMQGANNNTMGDIVSGVLGAVTYVVIRTLFYKREKKTGVR
ncbi:MAG: hypothetical protein MR503_02145 [Oscillospiraceae bacterium]|nr:hypothetical protein [Oscillospiraceae bacterium]